MRKLVVIGGSGFLGRHLLTRCVGWDLTSVDRVPYWAGRPEQVREVVAEARDVDAIRDACMGADVVWVRAGLLGGAASVDVGRAHEYIAANTDLVRTLLQTVGEVGVNRIVFDSSEQVWGTSGDLERQVASGEPFAGNFYGASKLIAEKLIRMWTGASAERSAQIFRYSRVRAALTPDVLHHMAKACLAGAHLRLIGNPAHRISFVHADDVIAANLAALELTPRYAVYQVSADRPYSLWELAHLVREIAGVEPSIDFDFSPPSRLTFEPFVTGMEWEESARRLGTTPQWSVAAMISETLGALRAG